MQANKEFIEANKDSFIILFFDAEFSGQKDLVEKAVKVLNESPELKDKIVVGSVDVEESDQLATELDVPSVPMVVCLLKGKVVRRIDILEPNKLESAIKEELQKQKLLSDGSSDQPNTDPKERFQEYLKKLVNRSNVMIFMKGDPSTPRCGFSKQLVELLNRNDVKYDHFDILQDEEVRQGLKVYSDWPTYPQIYVKGEFVGGLDILKQLEESGELKSTLSV